ncbi:MAG: archaellin/type IV pilin N-terminal domain-containing protein [Vulcanisaeta sp.]|uniref:archaellin/type IV pilin N-terminal domain-containing protein n=1 Tax=Vulcanisaeta sp. TaxID=2020871 RepID=UPI003D120E04
MTTKMNRKGISNVVATIILIAVAIALAVAVAVWVFGLAGSASKTATLQVQAVGLNNVSSAAASGSGTANLVLLVSNPSSSGIGINGFTLGSLSCVFSQPLQIPAGTQGAQINIILNIAKGNFTGVSAVYLNGASQTSLKPECSGYQAAQVGIQYSGYITTVSGQTYPFTVTASS